MDRGLPRRVNETLFRFPDPQRCESGESRRRTRTKPSFGIRRDNLQLTASMRRCREWEHVSRDLFHSADTSALDPPRTTRLPMLQRALTTLAIVCVIQFLAPLSASAQSLATIRSQHAELLRRYAADLAPIVADLRDSGSVDEAKRAIQLALPADQAQLSVRNLPHSVAPPIPSDLPPDQQNALARFRTAREKHSIALHVLARQALNAGSIQYALDLVREAARQNPDNPIARRVLGFVRHQAEWISPFEATMRRADQVWHDEFGWLPASHVERYERGERFSAGRWMSAAQDAEIHRDFSNPWIIRTENYVVRTNHSLEQGVRVARQLETFHDYFVETFAPFFWDANDLQARFRGTASGRRPANPYQVHYFRLRDEYNQRLVQKIPKIAMTNGLYYTADKIAYFFHDQAAAADDALFHEATHQLMYEALSYHRNVGGPAHFWVIEGIACYMESFRFENGQVSVGDPDHIRVAAARRRYLEMRDYLPLARLTVMGVQEFQNLPLQELQQNYSQAAGMSHFFMHANEGRYRSAFIEHLAQLYEVSPQGRQRVQSLAELTGLSNTALDGLYGQYMESLGIPSSITASATPAPLPADMVTPIPATPPLAQPLRQASETDFNDP